MVAVPSSPREVAITIWYISKILLIYKCYYGTFGGGLGVEGTVSEVSSQFTEKYSTLVGTKCSHNAFLASEKLLNLPSSYGPIPKIFHQIPRNLLCG
jgi:hypothetical protein